MTEREPTGFPNSRGNRRMIRYCITVIEQQLTTAMPAALLFAALWNGGALRDRKILALGSAFAAFAAALFAVLRRTTAVNSGIVNAFVLAAILASGIVFIAALWRNGGSGNSRAGSGILFPLSAAILAGTLFFYTLPPLFLLPSEFVLAGQNVFSTEFLSNLAGAALGLALTALAGYALFRVAIYEGGSLPPGPHSPVKLGNVASYPPLRGSAPQRPAGGLRSPRTPNIILCALLLIILVNNASELARFLMARRIIPLWRGLFKVIMAAVNHRNVFIFVGIAIAALLPLILLFGKKIPRSHGETNNALNPAEKRKQRAGLRRLRRYCGLALVLFGFSVFALTALKAWDRQEVALSPPEPFDLEGEDILIPIERIEDGRLHRFAWNASDGTEVRFIVIKKSASAWGVGLDACDICGNTGYYERRDGVICKLCDVVMNKSTIGFKGGCNPVPLAYTVRGGAMAVETGDLENEKGRFK